jgi:hypothetical protein
MLQVLGAAIELADKVEAAGMRVVKRGGRPALMQLSYDVKYGYNERSQLAMSVWLSVPDVLRAEYVGVIIDEGGSESQVEVLRKPTAAAMTGGASSEGTS